MGIKTRIVREGDMLYNVWTQPDRRETFESNREQQQKNARRSDFAKPLCRVPELDMALLRKDRPDLGRGDKRAWEKYLNTSEGRKYRTTPKGRSSNRSFGGLPRGSR